METRPVSRPFIKPCFGAVTISRAWQMYGPPTREVNSGAEQNDVLFGVCCPNRGANRSASVCLLPNRQFCSAVCWAASSSDGGAHTHSGGRAATQAAPHRRRLRPHAARPRRRAKNAGAHAQLRADIRMRTRCIITAYT